MKRKKTGESQVFKQIWEERPRICENCCGILGNEAKAWFFSHKMPKSRRPDLRLDPDNIQLLCFGCHELYDTHDPKFEIRKNINIGKYTGGLE